MTWTILAVLDASCDGKKHEHGFSRFTGITLTEAKSKARDAGWVLSNRDKALCPVCSQEKKHDPKV